MEEDILTRVVKVETDLQKRIKEEKEKAHALVEEARKLAERELADAESGMKEAFHRAVEEARLLQEEMITGETEKARLNSEQIEHISDEVLRKIIMNHIRRILPQV